jgi:hypothetical protein
VSTLARPTQLPCTPAASGDISRQPCGAPASSSPPPSGDSIPKCSCFQADNKYEKKEADDDKFEKKEPDDDKYEKKEADDDKFEKKEPEDNKYEKKEPDEKEQVVDDTSEKEEPEEEDHNNDEESEDSEDPRQLVMNGRITRPFGPCNVRQHEIVAIGLVAIVDS